MALPHSTGTRPTGRRVAQRAAAGATLGLLAVAVVAGQANAASDVKTKLKGDLLTITGSSGANTIVLRLAAGDPATLELDSNGDGTADAKFTRSKFSRIDVFGAGGNDTIRIDNSGGIFTDTEQTRLFGDDGNDTITGSFGPETISGGAGDDTIVPSRGSDVASGDGGTDTFSWDPGDGSDKIDGGGGSDRLAFHGANVAETIEVVPAAGGRALLTRDIASISIDMGTLESVDVDVRGGADALGVGNLASTDVRTVTFDLTATGGGDGLTDTVVVNGTPNDDVVAVRGIANGVEAAVAGGATTRVLNGEPGLDHTYVEGAGGSDIVDGTGTSGADTLSAVANGPLAAIGGSSFGPYVVETADEVVRLSGLGGADTLNATGDLASITKLVMDGGDGADTLLGGNGADELNGGAGADLLDGNQGADTLSGNADDDVLTWDPGDASDTLEGGGGTDTLTFHGANIGEQIGVSANGSRVRVTRDIATVTLDAGSVERLEVSARGGADTVRVDDLSGTDLGVVAVDLAASVGGADGAADVVVLAGSSADDAFTLGATAGGNAEAFAGSGAVVRVSGAEEALDALRVEGTGGDDTAVVAGTGADDTLTVTPVGDALAVSGSPFSGVHVEAATETVRVEGRDGGDTISAFNGDPATMPHLVIDGGSGADSLAGGNGADELFGGDGADTLAGRQGTDTVSGDAGDDVLTWNPGDSSDTIEGGAGSDRLDFNGANIGEQLTLSAAAGGRVVLTRNIATITLDIGGVDAARIRALGGADIVGVGDLSSTELSQVDVDLAGSLGGGDGAADAVSVDGTSGDDAFTVSAIAGGVSSAVPGGATVRVLDPEVATDSLTVNGGAGADTLGVVGAVDAVIQLVFNQ